MLKQTPENCGPLYDARVEEKEVQTSLTIAKHESERALLFGLISASFLFGCAFGWILHCGCSHGSHAAGRVPDGVDRIPRRSVVA